MIVISNTSPIMNLAATDRMELLKSLYSEVIVSEAVLQEFSTIDSGRSGFPDIKSSEWITTRTIRESPLLSPLLLELDRGEAESIALGVELNADLLLIDERRARKVASRMGLFRIGLLGVLIEAKRRDVIREVKTILDDLIAGAGFWVGGQLYDTVLKAADEL